MRQSTASVVLTVALALGALGAYAIIAGPVGDSGCREPAEGHLGEVRAMVVNAQKPEDLFAATDRGLFRWLDGEGWSRVGDAFDYRAFVMHPFRAHKLWASGPEGGVRVSSDGGCTWRALALEELQVRSLASSPQRPDNLWAAGDGDLFRSTDGGATWTRPSEDPPEVRALRAHPFNMDAVYALTPSGVHLSVDGGASWERFEAVDARDFEPFRHFPDYFWLVNGTGVHLTKDGGGNWTRLPLDARGGPLVAVALHPHDHRDAYVATRDGAIYETTDWGASWREILAPGQ